MSESSVIDNDKKRREDTEEFLNNNLKKVAQSNEQPLPPQSEETREEMKKNADDKNIAKDKIKDKKMTSRPKPIPQAVLDEAKKQGGKAMFLEDSKGNRVYLIRVGKEPKAKTVSAMFQRTGENVSAPMSAKDQEVKKLINKARAGVGGKDSDISGVINSMHVESVKEAVKFTAPEMTKEDFEKAEVEKPKKEPEKGKVDLKEATKNIKVTNEPKPLDSKEVVIKNAPTQEQVMAKATKEAPVMQAQVAEMPKDLKEGGKVAMQIQADNKAKETPVSETTIDKPKETKTIVPIACANKDRGTLALMYSIDNDGQIKTSGNAACYYLKPKNRQEEKMLGTLVSNNVAYNNLKRESAKRDLTEGEKKFMSSHETALKDNGLVRCPDGVLERKSTPKSEYNAKVHETAQEVNKAILSGTLKVQKITPTNKTTVNANMMQRGNTNGG